MLDESQLVNIGEAAELSGITRRAFEYLLKRPGAPAPVLIRGKKFFMRDALERWNNTRPRRKKS